MLKAKVVAEYFLSKDSSRSLFNKDLIERKGRTFYEGNARLNKYLHLAQNIYIAKTGEKLLEEDFYAYSNGAVVAPIQENYALLLNNKECPDLPPEIAEFLDKIYDIFENADIDELIAISHEDPEWERKNRFYRKEDQRMDSLSHIEEYREQYADIIRVMDGM